MNSTLKRIRELIQAEQAKSTYRQQPTMLTAYRGDDDEPWRLIRVAKALGMIEVLSDQQELPLALHDHKGILSVNWRCANDYRDWAGTAERAWMALDGCDSVGHWIDGVPQPCDYIYDDVFPGATDCLTLLQRGISKRPGRILPKDASLEAHHQAADALLKNMINDLISQGQEQGLDAKVVAINLLSVACQLLLQVFHMPPDFLVELTQSVATGHTTGKFPVSRVH